jgi:hypothetical protein
MESLVAGFAWVSSELGPVEDWPESLRTAVAICLTSRFPILLWWGPEFVMIYNDGYRPMLGSKHPSALGRPGREVWPEIWHVIGPMLNGVLAGEGATWSDDQLLLLERNGYQEECYFIFSYSPIISALSRAASVVADRRAGPGRPGPAGPGTGSPARRAHRRLRGPVPPSRGHTVWVSVSAAEVATEVSGTRMLVGTIRDVTREHSLKELRTAAATLAAALAGETDLHELYGAALHGFGELFGGETVIVAAGGTSTQAITTAGAQAVEALPDHVRARLNRRPRRPPASPTESSSPRRRPVTGRGWTSPLHATSPPTNTSSPACWARSSRQDSTARCSRQAIGEPNRTSASRWKATVSWDRPSAS